MNIFPVKGKKFPLNSDVYKLQETHLKSVSFSEPS